MALTQGDIYTRTLQPGQDLDLGFTVYPDVRTTLILYSGGSGSWDFTTVYQGAFGLDACINGETAVFTYWMEGSGWNYWPGGGIVCWPYSTINTEFYSGSSNVMYKVDFEHYGDYALAVKAHFDAN